MSVSRIMQQAAAGAAGGGATYVDDVFSTYLYDGTGSAQTITNGIDLAGEGGLVWIKDRSVSGQYNSLYDTERGANEVLISDQTWTASSANGGVSAFNDDGFSIDTYDDVNRNGSNLVSWTFRKQPGFFDVVTYTGNGTAGRTVSHNLGSVPGMIIVKCTTTAYSWSVYHRGADSSSPEEYHFHLEGTQARDTDIAFWNNTAPTSTEFTVGNQGGVNANGDTYVAYLFAHDAQDFGEDEDEAIIKCGSYTGNGSNNGPEIDLGFEPQWLLIKDASLGGHPWQIIDSMRGISSGGSDSFLKPNASDAESAYDIGSLTPTGFKITNNSSWSNTNGNNYIYVAIRRPHKPASEFAATDLLGIDNSPPSVGLYTGFPTDMSFAKVPTSTSDWYNSARLISGKYLSFHSTAAEVSSASFSYDQMDGYWNDAGSMSGYIGYGLRRVPGFFDVVTYTGTGVNGHQIDHNLGVEPELIIQKLRGTAGSNWHTWAAGPGSQVDSGGIVGTFLDGSNVGYTTVNYGANLNMLNAKPTSSYINVKNVSFDANGSNASGQDYVVYLFASAPGISKVGTYTGTGNSAQTIDCGFSAGARLVIIKRTDSSSFGDWFVFDSARGIVAGNDPFLYLNSTQAQNSSYDWIDPDSSGFSLPGSGSQGVNINGATYLFLAIA